jgi:hypothetical protein
MSAYVHLDRRIAFTCYGLTLLALGNGAADIISASVASTSDIFLAVGGAVGAGLFISTVTMAATILSFAKEVQVYLRVIATDEQQGVHQIHDRIHEYTTSVGQLHPQSVSSDLGQSPLDLLQHLCRVRNIRLIRSFVVYAVISDKAHNRFEPSMGTACSNPILIELRSIEAGARSDPENRTYILDL